MPATLENLKRIQETQALVLKFLASVQTFNEKDIFPVLVIFPVVQSLTTAWEGFLRLVFVILGYFRTAQYFPTRTFFLFTCGATDLSLLPLEVIIF